jgi:hypothetical protein
MTIKPPTKPFTGYAWNTKLNLKVALLLTDELRKAQIERKQSGSTFVIPVGPNLCMNAEEMARTLFREVKVVNKLDSVDVTSVDGILTPKFTYGSYMNVAGIIKMKLEWTLTDTKGNPVWAGTASGEGKKTTSFMYNPEDTVKAAVEELFKNSHRAVSSAQEIRQFTPRK